MIRSFLYKPAALMDSSSFVKKSFSFPYIDTLFYLVYFDRSLATVAKRHTKVVLFFEIFERMAITGLVRIPQGSDKVQKLQPGKQLDITELQKLSGMEEALNNLYKNHVQSFS